MVEVSGGEGRYTRLHQEMYKYPYVKSDGTRTSRKLLISFRDAVALAAIRFYTVRPYDVLEKLIGIPKQRLSECVNLAVFVLGSLEQCTWGRPTVHEDDWAELDANRVGCLQSKEFETVDMIFDGLKIRTCYPSDPDKHRAGHSSYTKTACMQFTIAVDSTFSIGNRSQIYAGSYGETACCIDGDVPRQGEKQVPSVFAGIRRGRTIQTDKGYNFEEHLGSIYGAHHDKPTEMAHHQKASMSQAQGSRSARCSRIRAVSERMVFQYKRWNWCDGKPVQMVEWATAEKIIAFITLFIRFNGPLPDHMGKQ